MLATETAGGFTGVYFALYATGNGRACIAPARFDYFQYVSVGADINRKKIRLEAKPRSLNDTGMRLGALEER